MLVHVEEHIPAGDTLVPPAVVPLPLVTLWNPAQWWSYGHAGAAGTSVSVTSG
jgi:hypothetical protein